MSNTIEIFKFESDFFVEIIYLYRVFCESHSLPKVFFVIWYISINIIPK